MDFHTLSNDGFDQFFSMKGIVGILENNLHLSSVFHKILVVKIKDVDTSDDDLATCGFNELQNGSPQSCFTKFFISSRFSLISFHRLFYYINDKQQNDLLQLQ